jgi:hypothetical protein
MWDGKGGREGSRGEIEYPISFFPGLMMNVKVIVNYVGSWLRGEGGCPLDGVIEDLATAEISRVIFFSPKLYLW